jgi:hypothetical protein
LIDPLKIGINNSNSNIMDGITWEGLGGLSRGSIFRVSDSVNTSKPPGTSLPETPTETLSETTSKILTGEAFFYSPNLSWFLMTVGAWYVFPYDLEEQESSSNATTSMLEVVSNRLHVGGCLESIGVQPFSGTGLHRLLALGFVFARFVPPTVCPESNL